MKIVESVENQTRVAQQLHGDALLRVPVLLKSGHVKKEFVVPLFRFHLLEDGKKPSGLFDGGGEQ